MLLLCTERVIRETRVCWWNVKFQTDLWVRHKMRWKKSDLKKETKNINERRTRKKIKLSKTNATKRERAKKKKVVLTVLKLTSELMLWCCEKKTKLNVSRESTSWWRRRSRATFLLRPGSPWIRVIYIFHSIEQQFLSSSFAFSCQSWSSHLSFRLPRRRRWDLRRLNFTEIFLISSTFCPWSNWMLYHLSQQHFTFLHSFLFLLRFKHPVSSFQLIFQLKEEKKVLFTSQVRHRRAAAARWDESTKLSLNEFTTLYSGAV